MENWKSRNFGKMMFVVLPALLIVSFSTLAAAQRDAVRAIYEASAHIPTNVEGIHTFPAPPQNFNALTATDEELAAYGFPPRPDKTADATGYAKWARAMSVNPQRWNGELKPRRAHGGPAKLVGGPARVTNTATQATTANWSGVVNTLSLKKYSATRSFYYVVADFNVPVAKQAFNGAGGTICDGGYDIASLWVGLDGLNQADVLQGGIDAQAYCNNGSNEQFYQAWVEWFPAGAVTEFNVSQGDAIYVEVWDTSDTQGYVYLEDIDLQTSGTYSLTAPLNASGQQITLNGNQAEYIVERPCCSGSNYYPLGNYVWSMWDFAHAETFSSVSYDAGSISPLTWDLTMTDDSGTTNISYPTVGTNGYQGDYSIFFQDENCASSGGCTP